MKRLLMVMMTVIVMAVSLMGGFVGCTSKDDATLRFWAYQPSDQEDQNAYKALIQRFIDETGIPVSTNFVDKDNYKSSISSALGSRKKPDVAYLDQPMTIDYASDGTLFDMTSLFSGASEIFDSERFFDGAFETTVYNNKNYGVPLNVTTSVLFYNKALVNDSALPTNWAEWLQQTVPGSKALFEGIGSAGYASWYFQVFLENADGKLMNSTNTAVTFNSTQGQEAAQFIKDLYAKSPKTIRDTSDAFGNGSILFKLGSSSDIDKFDTAFPSLNYGVMCVPPKVAGGVSKSNIGGENLVIFNSSTKKENAQKLIEFLLREENMTAISGFTGNFAAIKDYSNTEDANKQVVLEQLETAQARPSIPKWLQVNDDYLATALEKILSDTNPTNIKTALDTAAQQATTLLLG